MDREDSRDGERPPGMRTPKPQVSGMTLPHRLKEASCHDTSEQKGTSEQKVGSVSTWQPEWKAEGREGRAGTECGVLLCRNHESSLGQRETSNSTTTTTARSDENKHVQGVLTGRGDTLNAVTCGDSQYTVLIHVQVFTTRLKRGPCVPSRLAD